MPECKYRFFVIKMIAVVMLAAIIVKLFDLQIINGDKYLKTASSRRHPRLLWKRACHQRYRLFCSYAKNHK